MVIISSRFKFFRFLTACFYSGVNSSRGNYSRQDCMRSRVDTLTTITCVRNTRAVSSCIHCNVIAAWWLNSSKR